MTLIAFPAERVSRPGDERTCTCGSTWFRLERTSLNGEHGAGVVQVSTEGDIVSYSGVLVCHQCGAEQV